ncbi:type III secretion system needle length determinant [Vibrio sp. 10N.222.52.C12]|uniref:type III secretion system needle length determinant n=1 Tax=Vibrio TaxID=662 RepID=UPI0038B47E57
MRVKHDHPNTAEFPQKVRQSPETNVSEALKSRFNNALKQRPIVPGLCQKPSPLYTAAFNLDKLETVKSKFQHAHIQQESTKDQTSKGGSNSGILGQPKTAIEADSSTKKHVKPNSSLTEPAIADKKYIKHKSDSPVENKDKNLGQSLSEKAALNNAAGEHMQRQEEVIVKKQSVVSSAEKKQITHDNQADLVSSIPSPDGLYRDPKAIFSSFQKDLKHQTTPIQLDGKTATAVQKVLNSQLQKPNSVTKEVSTLSNTEINVEAKTALSAFKDKKNQKNNNNLNNNTAEADPKLYSTNNLNQPTTLGEIILKNMDVSTPQSSTRDVNKLISKLVNKIYVSLPTANEKEVRLFLNEGQLKGGEISIKHDSSGYSVLIRQEHALSLINPNSKQELVERLQRLGIDQPIRISVSEQMNQQQDQQRSRQQRSIYDEWKPEDER